MIDPKEFLNKDNKVTMSIDDNSIKISGTFVCQECSEITNSAKLDEDKRKIFWYCTKQHYSEAKL